MTHILSLASSSSSSMLTAASDTSPGDAERDGDEKINSFDASLDCGCISQLIKYKRSGRETLPWISAEPSAASPSSHPTPLPQSVSSPTAT
jgi:hypothetical protein